MSLYKVIMSVWVCDCMNEWVFEWVSEREVVGCPIKPKMLKIKNVPVGCGSIGIDEQQTLKNYILSFKT